MRAEGSTATTSSTAERRAGVRRSGGAVFDLLFVPAVLLALALYLSATTSSFFTTANMTNVLLQASILAIVAFGITFVILAGELDLSAGTGSALGSVLAAQVMVNTGSIWAGVLAGIGFGLALGLVNGLLVTALEVPSFIATLGTFIIAQGIALALTNGGVVAGLPEGINDFTQGRLLGLPLLVWATLFIFLTLYFVQRQTTFGVRVLAVGGNSEAARLSGVPVNRIRLLVFLISGTTTGLAGLALLVRVQSGQPNANSTLALEAIAAVVVGGTSLLGGRGSIVRTLWGVLLIAVLRNGLDLKGIDENLKQVVIGVVFIVAASVDFLRRQVTRRRVRASSVPKEPDGGSMAAPTHNHAKPLEA
jgi:ribose/xylose/arabinose/galactoside ABC-type transport system permease subunit